MKRIETGMKVHTTDRGMATVMGLLVDQSNPGQGYLVLEANGYFAPDVVAPLSAVWLVDDCVHLTLSSEEVAALPTIDQFEDCFVMGLSRTSTWRYSHHKAAPVAPKAAL